MSIGGAGGVQLGSNLFNTNAQATPPPSPLANQYAVYNAGIKQQAGDYDSIMAGYKNLASQPVQKLNAPQTYTPQSQQYNQSSDLTGAIGNLQNLSQTGGYSQQDQADIRARGISPIRSIYASAQRDIDRSRRLQGGFSPNYAAVKAKMARELSDTIANQVQNVNADIAGRVAQGRLSVAPQLASVTGSQSDLQNQIAGNNVNAQNQAQQFNIQTPLQYQQANMQASQLPLQALQGMTSLYGTTPALVNTFGNQAAQANAAQQAAENNQREQGLQYLNSTLPRFGR